MFNDPHSLPTPARLPSTPLSRALRRRTEPPALGPECPWRRSAGDEPIIDAARIPLAAFRRGSAPSQPTLAKYVWLRVLRPALTLAMWSCVIGYAWPYVRGARAQPEVLQLLGLYGMVIVAILLAMLLMAPWRRRRQRSEAVPKQEPSSLFALAAYIHVPTARLSTWQRARQLRVQHDGNGRLRGAADGTCVTRLSAPQGADRARRDIPIHAGPPDAGRQITHEAALVVAQKAPSTARGNAQGPDEVKPAFGLEQRTRAAPAAQGDLAPQRILEWEISV